MPRFWWVFGLVMTAGAAVPPLVDGPYPRAFFFRASEGAARNPRTEYDTWSRDYSRLFGIMGKVLDEEIPGTSARNVLFSTRFKADHPDQAVLLHYNGNARDPRVAEEFFPGHWLYRPGGRITADVSPADQVIHVENAGQYRTDIGRYHNRNEDLLLARYVDGRVDYHHAEHLELVSVDAAAGTITVRRGMHGTRALDYRAGAAVVQHHAVEGPWGAANHLLWFYNWRTDGPRDDQGRTAADILVAEFVRRFTPGGELHAFDGVEFDVLSWSHRGVDSDGDNRVDDGLSEGVNAYGLGVYDLCRRLREALGDKLWMADGWSAGNQRCVGVLNGIESEGWPTLTDREVIDWSGGLNRHRYWTTFAAEPRFSYVNHKTEVAGEMITTPLSTARLVQAACVMMDSGFCYSMPPPGPRSPLPIYDELVAGEERRPGWLGRPLGPPLQLARESRDLLAGVDLTRHDGSVAVARVEDRWVLTPADPRRDLRVTLATTDLPPGDVVLIAQLRSAPPAGMPAGVPRRVEIQFTDPNELMDAADAVTGMTLRDGRDRPLDPATGAVVRAVPSFDVGGEARDAIFVHPPYLGAAGASWFERTVTLPERASLSFFTGLPQRPGVSDGVTFIVTVETAAGEVEQVFREHRVEHRWLPGEVDLSRWSGQRVTLRFACDSGPADNATADHGAWSGIRLSTTGVPVREPNPLTPRRIMSWAGPEWFEASFAFRDLGPGRFELRVTAEDGLPLELAGLELHASPDVWVRRFEHGLVLANPSLRPVTVDLTRLAPGARYRRIRGTANQDPGTNDGSVSGRTVVLPPRDGLFLLAAD